MTTRCGRLAVLPLLIVLIVLGGCAKRPAVAQVSAPAPTGAVQPAPAPPPAAQAPAPAPVAPAPVAPAPPPPSPPAPKEFAAVPELQDIHFDFDKYTLRPDAAKILDANARWLKANPNRLVLVEGHCDERGTNEYNLALGERRAKAAMSYLEAQGVAASRFTMISYGEERPLCTAHSEDCWAKNRRAHFLVKPQ
ncbi:MAG: peptidoglycan-associated lipoprotein [Candidatus Rokubacteria bacterium 13_1_40CM_69_27]|nr:MAG: peptidoglycan-associated lipoprotein [Candidatus Rokubacteria bacterium 13_1_40CM_69_27]